MMFQWSLISFHRPHDEVDAKTHVLVKVTHQMPDGTPNVSMVYLVPLDLCHEEDALYRHHFGKKCEALWLEYLDEHVARIENPEDLPYLNEVRVVH